MAKDSPADVRNKTLTREDIQPKAIDQNEASKVLGMPAASAGAQQGPSGPGQSREERIARLKAYQYKKGQTGNPGGVSKARLPLSDGILEILPLQVPENLKLEIEVVVGKLPDEFTWRDLYCLAHFTAMMGMQPRFRLDVAREIREAAEGKSANRIVLLDPPKRDSQDDIKKKLWAWFAEAEVERCKLFGMQIPEDTNTMAKQMGIDLLAPDKPESEK